MISKCFYISLIANFFVIFVVMVSSITQTIFLVFAYFLWFSLTIFSRKHLNFFILNSLFVEIILHLMTILQFIAVDLNDLSVLLKVIELLSFTETSFSSSLIINDQFIYLFINFISGCFRALFHPLESQFTVLLYDLL